MPQVSADDTELSSEFPTGHRVDQGCLYPYGQGRLMVRVLFVNSWTPAGFQVKEFIPDALRVLVV